MIELLNFSKRYGDLLAVDDLNLKIGPGEMFGFIGPNGAGKSTTIRFLATLLKATAGDGIVNGHRVKKDPLGVRRSVGCGGPSSAQAPGIPPTAIKRTRSRRTNDPRMCHILGPGEGDCLVAPMALE